jgi:hypothetical protein
MDAHDRVAVVRRARGRVQAPEVEHVLVPAAFAGRDVALPDAEPAELLRGVEQLSWRAARAASARERVTSARVQTIRPPPTRVQWASTQNASPAGPRNWTTPLSAGDALSMRASESLPSEPEVPGVVKSSRLVAGRPL